MEKIRNDEKSLNILSGYTPYYGYSWEELKARQWELVYFIYPYCDGTCAHCWSSETFLGRPMPIVWHQRFWRKVKPCRIREVKFTGGEPFLYKHLGKVVNIAQKSLGANIPIKIFTSGRQVISLKEDKTGIYETVINIWKSGIVINNVEIHLSADEHHAGSLYRANRGIKYRPYSKKDIEEMNKLGIPLLQIQVKNFLAACDILISQNKKFGGGKIKIHAEKGRLDYHRRKIFFWLNDATWKDKVIASEGIIKSGSAQNINSAVTLLPNSRLSLFILPGAEFYKTPKTKKAQRYQNLENKNAVFLDVARTNGYGASIVGWWNIVNKIFCGGSAYDSYKLIG